MRPLSRFFRPPPALGKLETPAAVLDEAAVRNLPDGEALRDLAGLSAGASPASPSLERTAQERVAQLIDADAIDFDGLCAAPLNVSALLSVAGLSSNPNGIDRAVGHRYRGCHGAADRRSGHSAA